MRCSVLILVALSGVAHAEVKLQLAKPDTGKVFQTSVLRYGVATVDDDGSIRVVLFEKKVRCDTPDTDVKGWALSLATDGDASIQNGAYNHGSYVSVPVDHVKLTVKNGKRVKGTVKIDYTDPRKDADQRVRVSGTFDVQRCK